MKSLWLETEKVMEQPLLSKRNSNAKGGFRTLPFIIGNNKFCKLLINSVYKWMLLLSLCVAANEACERLASLGLMPNMILYLTREYGMHTAEATNFLLLWSAATNFMPLIGAFLADSYFGRYPMIAFGSVASLLVPIFFLSFPLDPCDCLSFFCH